MDPLKIRIMDVDKHVEALDLREVTSSFIKDSASGNFDAQGLFSEEIFGETASTMRLLREGYISLNANILHPKMYDLIVSFSSLYASILDGSEYAKFDKELGDFVKADMSEPNADTGYLFFSMYADKLRPERRGAIRHDTKVAIYERNLDKLFISKVIVLPAGLRDYTVADGRGKYDDINKLYMTLINLSKAAKNNSKNRLFNPVFCALQRKVNELFAYLWDLSEDKKGFFQGKYGARDIALGTRNVINATEMTAMRPDASSSLKSNEALIPLYQVINMYKPQVVYALKLFFFNNIFNRDSVQASLIDPKTNNLVYVTVPLAEKAKFLTSDKINDMIYMFRDDNVKHNPVSVKGEDGKRYYLMLTYRHGDMLYLVRNVQELDQALVKSGLIKELDLDKLKPLTYFEMFYIAAKKLGDRYATITRFPVTSGNSVQVVKTHIATTSRYETLRITVPGDKDIYYEVDRFPVNGSEAVGGITPHPNALAPTGADFDGDTVTCIGVMSEEANNECRDYLNSPASIIGSDSMPIVGLSTKLCSMALLNMTRVP
jgi:hypothetical protein